MSTGTYEYQSDFARHYYSQGKAEGEVTSLLAVLGTQNLINHHRHVTVLAQD